MIGRAVIEWSVISRAVIGVIGWAVIGRLVRLMSSGWSASLFWLGRCFARSCDCRKGLQKNNLVFSGFRAADVLSATVICGSTIAAASLGPLGARRSTRVDHLRALTVGGAVSRALLRRVASGDGRPGGRPPLTRHHQPHEQPGSGKSRKNWPRALLIGVVPPFDQPLSV
jgi:hypothetical protein